MRTYTRASETILENPLAQRLGAKTGNLLIVAPSFALRQYYFEPAFGEEMNLTLVIFPSSAQILQEVGQLSDLSALAALTNELFPAQARELLQKVAKGDCRILMMTPESFLYWFVGVEHHKVSSDQEKTLQSKNQAIMQAIRSRLSRIVLYDFDLINQSGRLFKPKYLEIMSRLESFEMPMIGLAHSCSQSLINQFRRFFREVEVIHEDLRLDGQALHVHYALSRQEKEKILLELLRETRSTLLYIPRAESSLELIQLLRERLGEKMIKVYHAGQDPEQKAEAVDFYLHAPKPLLVTSVPDLDQIKRPTLERYIHYSVPPSLPSLYRDISTIFKPKSAHLVTCEDDFNPNCPREEELSASYNRDGMVGNTKRRFAEIIEFMKAGGCRWQALQKVLTGQTQDTSPCGRCDDCQKTRSEKFLSAFSLFMLSQKFKFGKEISQKAQF
ncbi:MAG: hypothetical protein SFT81_02365 [Candidatus Caenarcaniphilales bacterium]|nr:hypothetical protein [Candidatus Caenarcaniphilales bacterium]